MMVDKMMMMVDFYLHRCVGSPCANGGTCSNQPGAGFQWVITIKSMIILKKCWSYRSWYQILDLLILTLILYRCTCLDGYTGATCAEDVDECLQNSNICNNGICRNLEGSFECFCRPGYSGSLCNHEFDECLSNPCLVSPFPHPPLFILIFPTRSLPSCAAWELHEPGQQLPLRLSTWLWRWATTTTTKWNPISSHSCWLWLCLLTFSTNQ